MIDFERIEEELNPQLKGGDGTVKARRFLSDRMKISRLTLGEGCSIGLHMHDTSCEVIYVLSGEANFVLDGSQEVVKAGQCHYCPKGSEHTVCNRSAEPLVMLAVIPELEK